MPYLLHDRDTPYNQWHQQRVLIQPSASTTVELFALVTMTDIEQAQALLTRLAKRRNPLDALRQTNQHELQKLPLTPKRASRAIAVKLANAFLVPFTFISPLSLPWSDRCKITRIWLVNI